MYYYYAAAIMAYLLLLLKYSYLNFSDLSGNFYLIYDQDLNQCLSP